MSHLFNYTVVSGMSHQIFILWIVSVSHLKLKHVITINNMILALIDFI